MQRGFYHDDFEDLIKQKADQYKMYPSDQVWKKVYKALHTRKKWYLLGFVLFFAGLAYYTIVELMSPSTRKPLAAKDPSAITAALAKTNGKAIIIPFTTSGKQSQRTTGTATREHAFVMNPDNETQDNNISLINTTVSAATAEASAATAARAETPVYDLLTGVRKADAKTIVSGKPETTTTVSGAVIPIGSRQQSADIAEAQVTDSTTQAASPLPAIGQLTPDSKQPEESEELKKLDHLPVDVPYEYALPRTKRLSWQLAFTPTMNYRKLTGNPNVDVTSASNNVPLAPHIEGDPDKLVNHKPALGFEIGTHALYAVNKNLSVRVGVQFNYSRYNIQAYSSRTEDVATITLSGGYPGYRPDALTSYTNIHNFGGDEAKELQNQYFQLSAPIGLEYRVFGNEKLQLKLAGTLQPTYLLNRNSYLITNDFTNYTKEPSLVRRWNMNAGAEVFLSYKTGELNWQVGPQFRYQLLSSYVDRYPIREYLMEYGFKIGVAKTIR